MRSLILFLAALICFTNCEDNDRADCSLVLCAPLGLRISILDKIDGANYIDKNNLKLTDFELLIMEDTSQNPNELSLNKRLPNGAELYLSFQEKASIVINTQDTITFTMQKSELRRNGCCDLGEITNVEVADRESIYNMQDRTLVFKL